MYGWDRGRRGRWKARVTVTVRPGPVVYTLSRRLSTEEMKDMGDDVIGEVSEVSVYNVQMEPGPSQGPCTL